MFATKIERVSRVQEGAFILSKHSETNAPTQGEIHESYVNCKEQIYYCITVVQHPFWHGKQISS